MINAHGGALMAEIISGIYEIRNVINGKRYIGSAVNIRKRWNVHRCLLRSTRHHSRLLQNSWNKYGEIHFVFSILRLVQNVSSLIEIEQCYIDNLKPEYNIQKIADSRIGVNHTEETRKRMSINHADVSGPNNPNFGVKASEEKRRKMRDAHADFSGKNNPNYGKNTKPVLQFTKNMDFLARHNSITEASRAIGVTSVLISRCISGKYSNKTAGNYIWRYADTGEDNP
jgi:group I intron endonuclease